MLDSIRRTMRNLRSHTCGNATLLLALGMPALVGGAGLAVDTAQWYMWKRELQFAVDQAALAGAWARTEDETKDTYQTRALQELSTNINQTSGTTTTPVIGLSNYAGGSANSVTVRVTASRSLPFSSFLTSRAAVVAVYAQASFEDGESFSACLIAVDDDDSGAITIGGNATLTASCGIAALSNSATAVVVNGNPTVDAGWVLAKGGIDDWFDTNTDDAIHENLDGLVDPFAALSPPDNPTARSYNCVPAATSTTATTSVVTTVEDKTYTGSNQNSLTLVRTTPVSTSDAVVTTLVTVPNSTVAGTSSGSTTQTGSRTSTGSGNNRVYTRTDRVTTLTTTYSDLVVTTTGEQASMLPGTYTGNVDVRCTTVLSPGIYVFDGGRFKVTGQHIVTGSGIMIVLKNGAYIDIAGGASITLTAATQAQLETFGVSSTQAAKLSGMLVFEDRNSSGTNNRNSINGNASTILNGTIYLPKSDINFAGTAGVTSQCLLIAAARITIQGTANMSTFCPAGMNEDTEVASGSKTVKLVA